MRPYMYKAYQFSFNIEKYFIFLKTTQIQKQKRIMGSYGAVYMKNFQNVREKAVRNNILKNKFVDICPFDL